MTCRMLTNDFLETDLMERSKTQIPTRRCQGSSSFKWKIKGQMGNWSNRGKSIEVKFCARSEARLYQNGDDYQWEIMQRGSYAENKWHLIHIYRFHQCATTIASVPRKLYLRDTKRADAIRPRFRDNKGGFWMSRKHKALFRTSRWSNVQTFLLEQRTNICRKRGRE